MKTQPNIQGYRVWHGTMPVQFLYTAGTAGERFFQTLRRKGLFAVTRCRDCGVTYLPPRVYCENCFADLSGTWEEVRPAGRVHTFTTLHAAHDGRALKTPQVVAFVRIDGTDGGLVGRLLDIRPADARIEMPVAAVLVAPRRRTGRITDILGFAPRRGR